MEDRYASIRMRLITRSLSTAVVGHPGHARKNVHGSHRIRLRQTGNVPEFSKAQFLHRHSRGFLEARPLPASPGLHDHGIQLDRLLGQGDLEPEVGRGLHLHLLVVEGVADASDGQAVAAGHQVTEGEEAESVGAGHALDGGIRQQPEARGRAATGTATSERTRPLTVASSGSTSRGALGTMMTCVPSST